MQLTRTRLKQAANNWACENVARLRMRYARCVVDPRAELGLNNPRSQRAV
jgi:hypothetical protein